MKKKTFLEECQKRNNGHNYGFPPLIFSPCFIFIPSFKLQIFQPPPPPLFLKVILRPFIFPLRKEAFHTMKDTLDPFFRKTNVKEPFLRNINL